MFEDAKCAEIDPELFFPTGNMNPQLENLLVKVCANCPAFVKCRNYSIHHDVDGFWAGTTHSARKRMQKERGITPTSMAESYIEFFLADTPAAKYKRKSRESMREAS